MLTETFRLAKAAAVALAYLAGATFASELGAPEGDIILTVTGDVGLSNPDGMVEFDLDLLRSLGEDEFITTTIWTEGPNRFTGIPLASLLETLRVETGTLKATAINDYSISFPVVEARAESAILAYAMNGKEMSLRDKGPLWIIYPFDTQTNYQSEVYYSRSIWQLDRLEVVAP